MGFDSERIESHSTVFRNMMSDKPMTEKKLEAVMRIFDIGGRNCRLTLCYAEWFEYLLRE